MSKLLDPLNEDQQLLVDLVAEAFALERAWPFFRYLEAKFDHRRKDAWATALSFPRVGRWSYSALWWVGSSNSGMRATATTEIELTLVGLQHSDILRGEVGRFLSLLETLAIRQRFPTPVSMREPHELMFSDSDATNPDLAATLLLREPSTFVSVTPKPDGGWTAVIPRSVLDYEDITSIDGYVERLETLSALPTYAVADAVPSPLDLVAALDYLDVTWINQHKRRLFDYPSAERAAKLSHPVATPEELDSRLEDVPRAVEFRRRSRCGGQALTRIAASLVGACVVSG